MKTRKNRSYILGYIYDLLEPNYSDYTSSKVVDSSIQILIIVNLASIVLTSFQSLQAYANIFRIIEFVSVVVFTIEYVLRILTSRVRFPNKRFSYAVLKYVSSPMAIIDLLAILPFYIPLMISLDLRFLRVLRLMRTLRILKLNRYSKSLQLLSRVLKRKKEELIVTLFVTLILIMFASTGLYYIEYTEEHDAFPNIIATSWWVISTLTLDSFDGVSPESVLGKIFSSLIALFGIGMVAIPTGIISSGFVEEVQKRPTRKKNMIPSHTGIYHKKKRFKA